ncbi:hypothetical protein HPB52_019329 [Rhipicephalus sanguineus]|uniref:Deoxynucleoside kinase domain-containing protein n=1 Tax=Rhipicephalus sanguineus TaxID=34632 RepID=A0A9D4Q283_RHISA|nr:hypothetical protein HPB52_019329 [Rhipicephalus sanguineus]
MDWQIRGRVEHRRGTRPPDSCQCCGCEKHGTYAASGRHENQSIQGNVSLNQALPYETKEYKSWRSLFDQTAVRFDENTRLIVVEGNIGSGKSALAKTIAEEFELKHVPEVCLDNFYVDDYGFDYRSVNNLLPESCRMFDIKQFYQDPHNIGVNGFRCGQAVSWATTVLGDVPDQPAPGLRSDTLLDASPCGQRAVSV